MTARGGVPRALVLVDWNWLHETGQLTSDQPLAERVREAAPRMGMTVDALEQALRRLGIRNPVPEGIDWRKANHRNGKDPECCRRRTLQVQRAEYELEQAARRLARVPDSTNAKRNLAERQAELERAEAKADWHAEVEHTSETAA